LTGKGERHAFSVPEATLTGRLKSGCEALRPWLVDTRRQFHRHPELGWREFETTRRIVGTLEGDGYVVTAGRDMLGDAARLGLGRSLVAGEGDTGCIANFDSGRPGPVVCLRVDIDALPIREAKSDHRPAVEGFASVEDEAMHACGHDGHIAIGLGVAKLIKPYLNRARGKLRILFQPAEEGGRGARSVVDAGWMADVDLFLAIHIGLGVPSGTVALGVDGFLATRKFAVTLTGRAAHAGKSPQDGRNALLAACQTALGLHGLAQSSAPNVRVNVGVMHAGRSLNIVPDAAVFEFEIRAAGVPELDVLDHRCRQMIEATASAWEVGSRIELRGEASDWHNPKDIVAWAQAVNELVAAFPRAITNHVFGASEDATLLANAVTARGGKAAIFVLGADLADGHHTPHFDFDERVLGVGVLLLSALIAGGLLIDFNCETPNSPQGL
jgi:aminobenzoyl-glutamate utilization protein A